MPTESHQPPLSIALVALPETTPTAIYGLFEIFSAVAVAWTQLTGETTAVRPMRPHIVARTRDPFLSALGTPIAPQAALADLPAPDIVVVTDLALAADADPRGRWPEEAAWLRGQFARGATICSVCTGSLFLAEAGLLDGREATTHWSAARLFADRYPAVRLCTDRILCAAGPDLRVVTSGGAASWEDLALHLIARFCGEAEAVRIAKIFLLGDRSEGQLPFSAGARPRRHDDAVVAECQSWIADHYAGPNPVARMVARSGLAERTFKRRFKTATGYAPVDYVQALRVEEAKQMLETTRDATDTVAHAVGYEDPAFFRRLFKRLTGVTPARYRQRFQSITRLKAGG